MKKGFAVLELVFVVGIIGILAFTVIINCMALVNRARFQATVREMESIAQAAIDAYNSSNNPNDPNQPQVLVWPSGTGVLSNQADANNNNMPQALVANPFGYPYQLSAGNNMITVITTVPQGLSIDQSEGSFLTVSPGAGTDQISISQSIPNAFSARLNYDLQYLYKP